MIKVSALAKVGTVTIQDPRPEEVNGLSQIAWTLSSVDSNGVAITTPTDMIMPWSQLERLTPLLDRLAAEGLLTYELAPAATYMRDGVSYTLPNYAEQPESDSNPSIDSCTAIAVGGGSATVAVNNLLGNQTFAVLRMLSDEIATTWMDVVALNAGTSGNSISVRIIDSLGGGLTVVHTHPTVDTTLITIDLGGAHRTIDVVVTAFNTAMAGIAKAVATDGAVKEFTTARAAVNLAGGLGTGFSVTLGGAACVVTNVTGTFNALTGVYTVTGSPVATLTITAPALTSAAIGSTAMLQVRSDNKVTNVAVPVTLAKHEIYGTTIAAVDSDANPAGTAVPLLVTGLSFADFYLKVDATAANNVVRVVSQHSGTVANDITFKVVVAADDNLAVTWSTAAKTLTVALANGAAPNAKNAIGTVATAINNSTACSEGYLFAKSFGSGNLVTANNPTAFTAINPAYGGDFTFTVGGLAVTQAAATKVSPVLISGSRYILTGTTVDMSAAGYAFDTTSIVQATIGANEHTSSLSIPTA
jgi:hypothetical protein